jgi:hypothetical protein
MNVPRRMNISATSRRSPLQTSRIRRKHRPLIPHRPGVLHLLPGILRWLPRTGRQYYVGDVLFHVENRLHGVNAEQRAAIRDLLYIVYDRLKSEIESTAFDYPTIWRILNELDRSP